MGRPVCRWLCAAAFHLSFLDVVCRGGKCVVAFDEVDPPIGVQLNDGVVIGVSLKAWWRPRHTFGVPGADRAGDGNILGSDVGTINRQVCLIPLPWDAPHDVGCRISGLWHVRNQPAP